MNTTARIPAAPALSTFTGKVKVLFALMLTLCFSNITASAQSPAHLGTDVVSNPTYATHALTDFGAFRQARLQATVPVPSGVAKWEFTVDNGGSPDYVENWRPYTFSQTLSGYNVAIDPATAPASARYNGGFGGATGNMPAVTAGNYYTFNIEEVNAPDNALMSVLETSYNPVSIASVSLPISPNSIVDETISITTSATPNAGESIYVRYSTDGFASSAVVPFTMVGSNGTADIPAQPGGTSVDYYVFSSPLGAAALAAEVVNVGDAAYDMATLSINNNGGGNYVYTSANVAPIITAEPANANACTGDDVSFSVTAIGDQLTYQWQSNNGFGFTNLSDDATYSGTNSATLLISSVGLSQNPITYQVVISGAAAPDATSATVAVVVGNLPTTSNAGPDQDVCGIDWTTLAGNTPTIGNGTWSVLSGTGSFLDATSPTTVVSQLSEDDNVFIWTIANAGCPVSTDTVTIHRDLFPSQPVAGDDQTVCSNSATLEAVPASVGHDYWSVVGLGSGTFAAPSSASTTVTNLTPGQNQMCWKIENGSCGQVQDCLIITYIDSLDASFTMSDATICTGQLVDFTPADNGHNSYDWDFNDGNTATNPSPSNTYNTAGSYNISLTVTDENGCTDNASATLLVQDGLSAAFAATDAACGQDSTGSIDLTVSSATGVVEYLWSTGAITEDVTNLPAGTYNVTVMDASGCVVVESTTIGTTSTLAATITEVNGDCANSASVCVGEVALNITGGTAPYTLLTASDIQFEDDFDTAPLDLATWTVVGGSITQITGSGALQMRNNTGNWTHGLYTTQTFSRQEDLTFQGSFFNTGGYRMMGWHDNSTSASYTALVYAIYSVNGGQIQIYEDGNYRGQPTTMPLNTWVDFKIELKAQGARYFVKLQSSSTWLQIYNSNYSTETNIRPGVANHTNNDVFFDNFRMPLVTASTSTDSLCAGETYSYLIEDANGCQITQSATVSTFSAEGTVTEAGCQTATGAIDISVSSGEAPYTFVWSNGASTEDISNLSPGNYDVEIHDANGCDIALTFTVPSSDDVPPTALCQDITVTLSSVNSNLQGGGTASISANQVDAGSFDDCGVITSMWVLPNSFDCSDVGDNQVTLIVEDDNDNQASCTAIVTVIDDDTLSPPSVTCQDISINLASNGYASIVPGQVVASTTGACGTLTVFPSSFDCSDLGPNNVTVIAYDDNGDFVATCNAVVTVVDPDQAPAQALCQDITVNLGYYGYVDVSTGNINNGSVFCGSPSLLLQNGSSSIRYYCADAGVQQLTMIAQDANDSTSSCISNVTVQDISPPTFSCSGSPDYYLNANGFVEITNPSSLVSNLRDNCGTIASIAVVPDKFDCDDVGRQNVTVTVTDQYGNFSTCVRAIDIRENVAPQVFCRDTIVYLNTSGNAYVNSSMVLDSVYDNCGISQIQVWSNHTGWTTGNALVRCSNVPTATILVRAQDLSGNWSSNCTAYVTVADTVPPVARCRQNISYNLNTNGQAFVDINLIDNGSSDACTGITRALSRTTLTCDDVPSTVIDLIVTDAYGNTDTCQATVLVNDINPPSLTCVDNIILPLDSFGGVFIEGPEIIQGSADNCPLDFTFDVNGFSCLDIQSSFVDQNLTFGTINVGPVSTAWQSVTMDHNGRLFSVSFNLDAAASGTLNVYNGEGNGGTLLHSQPFASAGGFQEIILSNDQIPITVGQQITWEIVGSGFTLRANNADFYPGGISDTDPLTDYLFQVNMFGRLVTATGTDPGGLDDDCEVLVTVTDNLPPNVFCRDTIMNLAPNGELDITMDDISPGTFDNCGIDSLSISPTHFDCSNLGTHTINIYARDVFGQVNTCTAQLTVIDTAQINVVCRDTIVTIPNSGTLTLTADDIDGGSTLTCGVASRTVSPNTFTCADVGTTVTVTMTVTDISNNTYTCTSAVTIEDNTDPVAVCQDATLYLDAAGQATITAAQLDNGSSDNCSAVTVSINQSTFGCSDAGKEERTDQSLAATDTTYVNTSEAWQSFSNNLTGELLSVSFDLGFPVSGSLLIQDGEGTGGTVLHSQTILVLATGPTTITLDVPVAVTSGQTYTWRIAGSNISLAGNAGDAYAGGRNNISATADYVFETVVLSDNPVTLTATDADGNTGTCVAQVIVIDTIAPAVVCQDITVQLDASGNASITASQLDGGSTDVCGIESIVASQTDFTCDDIGIVPVTLTVTDSAGASATCIANVTVTDTIGPIAQCRNVTVELDPQTTLATVTALTQFAGFDAFGDTIFSDNYIDNGSYDQNGCAALTYEIVPDTFDCSNVGFNDVTLIVTDASGNVDSCTAQVLVEDNIPLTVNCNDTTVYLDGTGQFELTVSDVASQVVFCELAAENITPRFLDCNDIPVSPVNVVVTLENANGQGFCFSQVTVLDSLPPVVVCQDITVQLDANGNASITAADVDNGSADNCDIAARVVNPSTFDCSNVGPNTVTLTVTDIFGNESQCTATVTVEDNIAPTAVCQNLDLALVPGNATLTITPAMVNNNSSDNCTIDTMFVSPTTVNCSQLGNNNITLTVIDVNGNQSTCISVVTVADTIPPTALCQDLTIYLDGNGDASITPEQVDNGSNDECGILSLVLDQTDFDCSEVGPNTVTLTVTDSSNVTATCTATITVLDTIAPNAVCQDVTVQLDAAGNASITAADINNNSSDNCSIDAVTVSPTMFDCSNVGANTVTLTVEDSNGNISTCTATVTVEDNIAPTAICQNFTVNLDAGGGASISTSDINNGSFDNCGNVTLSLDKTAFTCANIGNNSVTLTVTDDNGNSSTCGATVTVVDDTPPNALCQNITVQLDALGNASITAADVDGGSNDNCGNVTTSIDINNFTCANIGNNTVTLTVTDDENNVSTCQAVVTVEDNIIPNAICQDLTVQLDASGNAVINASQINNGSSDNCAIDVVSVSPSSFDCSNVGANTVTLTVTDVNGNVGTCTATVTVEDNIAPTAICQNISVNLDASGNATITAAQINNSSFDNCTINTMTLDKTSFTCADLGQNVVELTVTDVNGNVRTCQAQVSVTDNIAPTAVCQNITVYLDASGTAIINAADVDGGSTDNCGTPTVSIDATAFNCTNVGANTVTLTATDGSGNTDQCTAMVQVLDTIPPTAICQNIELELDATCIGTITAAQFNNGSNDACGIASLSINNDTFTCANVGPNNVTLTVTDNNGNVSTATCVVTVTDNTPPTAECKDVTVYVDAAGNATIAPADVDNGSSDASGPVTLSLDQTAFDCSQLGPNTVTLTVADINGNLDNCSATVTVLDTIAPAVSCNNINVYLDALGNASITTADIDGGNSDNCTAPALSLDNSTFGCANIGSNTVTLTATDGSGNSSSCTATVMVNDTVAPTAICQNLSIALNASGMATITAADINNGSNDACGILSLSIDKDEFSCGDVGANTVTLTVTDNNNNVSTCTATVTVEDNTAPTALCQNITVYLDALGNASITPADIDGGSSDNCTIVNYTASQTAFSCTDLGSNSVQLTVEDANGNIGTCIAMVSVLDSIAPTAVCKDITVTLDGLGNATISGADIDNGSDDNCDGVTTSVSPSSFTCTELGANTVTMTVTDGSGNTTTCEATVTVQDVLAPVAICQNLTVQLDGSGNATITAADVNNGSNASCGIDSLILSQTSFDCSHIGTNTVTLSVVGNNGLTTTCNATVTVQDNTAPTAVCQDVTVYLDGSGNASIIAGDIDNGSADNCGTPSISVSPTNFDCSDVGANTVTLTVNDGNGNVSNCTATVTVLDSIAPTAVCQNVTVNLDASGNATVTAAQVDNGSADNCGTVSLALSQTAFDCSHVGANSVTLTVTDANNNSTTCSAVVNVVDNTPPTALCQNITVALDASGNANITAADINNGSSDNCTIASTSIDVSSFDCSDIGNNTVTLTVTDVNSNVSTCTATVTVEDNTAPTAVCQDVTVYLDGSGNASITAGDIDNGSADNCGTPSISVSPTNFDCSDVGANSVTLTVDDGNGNVSNCTATVTVLDSIAPTAVCQNVTVNLDASGNATVTAAQVDNGSADNCGTVSLALSQTAFDCSHVGANSVTLTVTDANNNSTTCSAVVNVVDNTPPTALCQNITVALDASGNANITAADINNGSSDNCTIASTSIDVSSFDCSNIGNNTVTLTVTDVNLNVATCTATVTVEDNTAPTAVCQDVTVYLDGSGNASITAGDIDNGSSDNCGTPSISVSPTNFDCADVGANTVTLTVDDGNGNVSNCTATVTVLDSIAPTAVCQNVTVNLDASGNATVTAAQVDNGSADNCGTVSLALSQTAFDCSHVGANSVTLTVTDANLNSTTCSAVVNVVDNTPPTALCQNITVQLDAAGNASITAADINNGSSDNCTIASTSIDVSSFDCSNIGNNTVTLTVTDVNSNVSTCTATVTVEDNTAPTAVCRDVTVYLDGSGNASITAGDIDNGSSDNCGTPSISVSPTNFDCSDVGANTVTLTVNDGNGNVSNCTATVTVLDSIAPTAVCQNVTVNLDASGNATVTAAQVDNGSADNCGTVSLALSQTAFDCSHVGANSVTLTVTDANNNSTTCSAVVNVVDNTPPTALCQNITVALDASGNASITAADINNGSSDNCTIASTSIDVSSFDCSNIGNNTVTLTVTDVNSNVSTCTATVTVEDNTAPTAVCQDVTIYLDGSGNASITAGDIDNGSNDNCGTPSISVSPTNFDCADVGANTVTLTVDDGNGNASNCTATVTVLDSIAPTAVCQNVTVNLDASGNATVTAAQVDNGSADNCGTVNLALSQTAFDCSHVGANSVTLTVTDANNNSTACSAVVNVVDNTPPTALCQNIIVQLDASGNASITAADVNNGSSDNCSVASTSIDVSSFDCSNLGNNTVTLTVTDVNLNVSTCTATVTVEDNVAPTVVCQNFTVALDASGNATIVPADVDGGSSDNCSLNLSVSPNSFDCSDVGANTVTLTGTDGSSNSASCTATVTVIDNTAPAAVCQDITVQLDASGNASIVAADIDNGSSDNCAFTLAVSPSTFDCANVGPNTVTLTVTDASNNASTCTATVTVEDNVAPVANCQPVTVYLDGSGNASITAADVNNNSDDACGIANLAINTSSFDCSNVGPSTVTLTVTDNNNNVATCQSTVTVIDSIAPAAVCQNITVQLDASGNASITGADIDGGSTDNCTIASLVASPNTFTCSNNGANTVTLTVTDVNGNASQCTATVTVEDNVDPIAVCQNITVQLDASGDASIVAADVDGGSSDACGTISLSASPTTFGCANVGANTVTLVVTDGSGNTDTCTAVVTVEDNVVPTAICQNITVQLDAAGNASITPAEINNGSNDACGIASTTINTSAFTCANVGPNVVELTVTDNNDNVSTCSAIVTVEDNVDPTAVCKDITVQLDAAGNASITGADINNGSDDACGVASLTASPNTFDCSNVGANTVTLTVTDSNGNTSTCTATVTVEDTVDPVALCQNITVQLDASGNASITANDVNGGSNDACGIASVTINNSSFDCSNVGANTVTLTATDNNGNTATCDATVTVQDNVAPTAVCQDITVQLDAAGNASITSGQIDNGSNDACGLASVTVSPGSFTCANVGANTVTLTVTDNNNNVSTCTATVTVEDNIAPDAVCQDITVQLDASGNVSITGADINNGSAAACGIATLVATPNSFDCSNVGANTVTLTVTDNNNNVATCTATVTVEDNVAPAAVCQNITVQLDGSGNASIVAADIDGGSTDACTIASLSASQTAFDCSHVGNNNVVLTVTDVNNNVSTCTAVVTVQDTVAPVAQCQSIDLYLDANGNASITAADIDNGSSDNCAIDNLSVAPANFSCATLGGNTVTLTVTDVNGNSSTCTANVNVIDTVAPAAVCQNITVQLDASGNASINAAQVNNGSSDACGIVSTTVTPNTFNCTNVGGNTVTLTVADGSGNSSTCTAVVTVEDNVAPNAVCQNITIQLDASGNASIEPEDVDNNSNDACGIATLAVSQENFTCTNVGNNTVVLTVTDNNGNQSTCQAVVEVLDQVAPVAVCQNITVQLDASGNASITGADVDGGSTDACGIASLTASPNSFTCANVGNNTVTLTVTDENGNTSTCEAEVTVEDNVAPEALCQPITVQLDASGNASITASQIDAGSNDACGIASVTADITTFDCSNVGGNFVTLTVTDVNGNVNTCGTNVTVEDNVAPSAVCQNITVQLDASGNVSITPEQVDNGSDDACGIANLAVSPNSFTCANVGPNTVTLTVTDNNNNVTTCTATVTVEDNVQPIAICQNITVQLDAAGNSSITANQIDNGSNDACGIASLAVTPNSFDCSNVGNNTVTLAVTDVNGNTNTCTANVTVEDNVAPAIVCQDITVQLDASGNVSITGPDVDGGSTDACGIATRTVSPAAFDCSRVGGNTVTLTVTDVNGNVSTCTATVTVEDNVAPTAVCQNIDLYLDASGNASITATDIDNGSNDACGVASLEIDLDSFGCADVGPVDVTLTVTDVNGNESTCTGVVTVIDTVAPVLTSCPLDQFSSTDAANCTAFLSFGQPTGTDACGIASITNSFNGTSDASDNYPLGSTTVVWTLEDVNGNTTTCTTEVLVVDQVAPSAVCQDITVQLTSSGFATITAADVDGGSSDGCGIQSLTIDRNFFTCDDAGANTVTLTVTDLSGNTSSCTATVTVVDMVPPVASCRDYTVQLDASGNASITANDVNFSSSDDCGIDNMTVTPSTFDCSNVGANTVTLTVTDVFGNSSTCTATVTVVDTEAPVMVCQTATIQLDANGVASITPADVDGGSSDNCGLSLQVIPSNFACCDVGVNTVVMIGTDVNGNQYTCQTTVTVEDHVAPEAICTDITVQLDDNGLATIIPSQLDGGSNDPCGVTLSISQSSFDCSNLGENTVTLTVVDDHGNSSTCTATVTIIDVVSPTITCPADAQAVADNNVCGAQVDVLVPVTADNCGAGFTNNFTGTADASAFYPVGLTNVIWEGMDASGNVGTCVQVIEVLDMQPPTVTDCPSDVIVTADSADCEPAVNWTAPVALDNCEIAHVTSTHQPGEDFPLGTTTVTYTYTDPSGNSVTCAFDVVVNAPTVNLSTSLSEYSCGYNVSCNGAADGSATVTVSGGCIGCGYEYLWSDGQTTETATGLSAGNFIVTVTDAVGTATEVSVSLAEPDAITATFAPEVKNNGTNISCPGGSDGSVELTAAGGNNCNPYTYAWSNGATTETISGLSAGVYTVTITDINGCTGVDSVTITEPAPLVIELCGDQNTALGWEAEEWAQITIISTTGGTPGYSYEWDLGLTGTSITVRPTESTSYSVTVTDANGCTAVAEHMITVVDIRCSGNSSSSGWSGAGSSGSGGSGSSSSWGGSWAGSGSSSSAGSNAMDAYPWSSASGSSKHAKGSKSGSNSGSSSKSGSGSKSGSSSKSGSGSKSGSSSKSGSGASNSGSSSGNHGSVYLCSPSGITYCVKLNKVQAKLDAGWSLGQCHLNLSFDGGNCGEPSIPSCGCSGGIAELEVLYTGPSNVDITVVDKHNVAITSFANVQTGDVLVVQASMIGSNKLGKKITFKGNDGTSTQMHTSCSQEIIGLQLDNYFVNRQIDKYGTECVVNELTPQIQPSIQNPVNLGAFPNPTINSTAIQFDIPVDDNCTVVLYDPVGAPIQTLYNGFAIGQQAYSIPFDFTTLPAAVYSVRLTTAGGLSAMQSIVAVE